MVPNWTIPNAIGLGNCMVIKPSEKVPLSVGRLAQLLKEAGLPDGVFNIVHGDSEIVEAICDHPGIEAGFICWFYKGCQDRLSKSYTKIQKSISTWWCKKSLDGFARCKSRYDGTECCSKHEWLRWPAMHGGKLQW
jgi:hypothetical protein